MDNRTRAQRWADRVTEFSGSWSFIGWFTILCIFWILTNTIFVVLGRFDPYPFLFLNWILTIISTFQNPLILLSQNRQNETERERVEEDRNKMAEVLTRLNTLQSTLNELKEPTLRDSIKDGVYDGLEPLRTLAVKTENAAKTITAAASKLKRR